ncbi:thiamine pyrophosphate-binding protein [Streptomyces coffeae]|uniref:Thiamine pyrophosphate-binding protein n=1 Tax=Streptomyces coffeae TaxID=621382 RepID=A0ABS1ND58_9ACTN|nr:thiamine pyrophosphate-binding protein [Streptomyces coffeae]MBL1097860.1 thiamine pyrophosphate-binding protein [Streptomyces coffeae]
MRVSDALVMLLRDWDTKYVFGVSGANIEHLHDAIHRLGKGKLRSVMARREDGAAFMADARARVHRTLGVCCATSGGAMMNLAVGLAESYAESVPVLALIGQPPTALEGRGAFQDSSGIGRTVDAEAILGAITKKVVKLGPPETFWRDVLDAVRTALSGRPGPVAVLVPRDVFEAEVGDRPDGFPATLAGAADPPTFDREAARTLFDEIRQAKRPVLVLGHGVRRSDNPSAVVRFARRTGLRVATTMSARAEFPNDDPRYLGVLGVAGHSSVVDTVLDADLVVAVGTGLNMMTRGPVPELNGAAVAVVNPDPGEAVRAVAPRIVVRGEAGVTFEHLLRLWDAEPFEVPAPGAYELRRFLPRLAPPVPSRPPGHGVDGDDLLQSEAISLLTAYLPRDGHVVLDAGNCASAAIHLSEVPAGGTSTIALGMGGMGYSLAAAVGAQLGSPSGTRTTVLCGDGAFLMNGLELHTAVDLRLPVLFVIFNNNMHGMCATRQQTFFEARIECVQYAPVDVAQVARGLGPSDRLWVGSAGTAAELRARLADYHERHPDLPGVLELRIPAEEMPPFTTLLPPDEPTVPVPRADDASVCAAVSS